MLDLTIPTGAAFAAGAVSMAALFGAAVCTGKRLRTMQPPEVKPQPFAWMDERDARDAKIAGRIDPAPEIVYGQSLRELREAHDVSESRAARPRPISTFDGSW